MRLLRWVLVLVLAFASWCQAATSTYYVDSAAADDSGTVDTPADPWQKVETAMDAINTANDVILKIKGGTSSATTYSVVDGTHGCMTTRGIGGNPNSLTIEPWNSGELVTLATTSTSRIFLLHNSGMVAGTITINDITFQDDPSYLIDLYDGNDCDLVFNRCTLYNTGTSGTKCVLSNVTSAPAAPDDVDVTFTDCTLRSDSASRLFYVKYLNSITVTNGSLIGNSTGTALFDIRLGLVNLDINGVAITDSGTGPVVYTGDGVAIAQTLQAYATHFQIRNCTGTVYSLFKNTMAADATHVSNIRKFTCTGNTLTSTLNGSGWLTLGAEVNGAGDDTVDGAPYQAIRIADNDVKFTAAGATHTIFLGVGANNAVVTRNKLISTSGAEYGIVMKNDKSVVTHNVIKHHSQNIYLSGATNAIVRNNSLYATAGGAFLVDDNQDKTNAEYNVVTDNVFSSLTSYAIAYDPGANATGNANDGSDDPAEWRTWIDDNVYWTGGTNVANVHGTAIARADGASAIYAAWVAYADADNPLLKYSDANSVVANPLFIAPQNGDLRLRSDSSYRGDKGAMWMCKGAWQRGEMTGKQPYWRLAVPREK